MSIVERAFDAALMFWQTLDERERMLLASGLAWFAVIVLQVKLVERKEREREQLADAVVARLRNG